MSQREDALEALFALGAAITFELNGEQTGWLTKSRRLKMWEDVPRQPAFFQAEPTEQITQATNRLSIRTIECIWVAYHQVGKNANAVPTSTNSLILDAMEAALAPDDFGDRLTLGGLAHHVWIEGAVMRDSGDVDAQALIAVPVRLQLP